MMYHAFGWVAALPDAPDWAREDFRSFMGTPAYHTTHPDEERFEYIRPGSHDGIITVCSTIEEGTEMWLWASAETIALYEKVFGKAGLPSPDDPMNAYYAEYGRACREDPKSLVALEPEVPDPDQMGGFTRIPVCKVPFTGKPPAVDGDADDPCWTQAVSITDFTLESNSGPSQLKTTVKLAWDRENLYVLMLAPDLKPPKRVRGRDGGQWQEDGIELFLDTNFDRTSYWQIVLNLTGESGDACYVQPLLSVDDWNPDFRFGRKPGVIEIAIPFKAFDCKWDVEGPVVPKRWSANFCRTGDGSSWVGYNMALIAHIPQGFGVLEFLPAREAGGD